MTAVVAMRWRRCGPIGLMFRLAGAAGLAVCALCWPPATTLVELTAATIPKPAHVVIVVEENRSAGAVIGNPSAPYINWLANNGASMSQSFAITHPSEPNYLALFAGSTFGVTSDQCPLDYGATANLGSELVSAGSSFLGFSEGLPSVGATTCSSGRYARKHAPWVNFTNVPAADSVPMSAFPADYASLPTVSFVIPNLDNDMHDGTVAQGDSWLRDNLSAYATWAKDNNSLLLVTWDEDDHSQNNQIPTIFYGADLRTGTYSEPITHYAVLSTIEQMYGLNKTGEATGTAPIADIWD